MFDCNITFTHKSIPSIKKMCTKPLIPRDMLSLKLVASPPWKKSMTNFGWSIIDSEKDEARTYSHEIGGRGGEKLDATIMQSNIKEEPKPNLDKVIDNIQVEPMCLLNL